MASSALVSTFTITCSIRIRSRSEERRVGKECRSRWWQDQAEDGIRDLYVTGVQTCALPIFEKPSGRLRREPGATISNDNVDLLVASLGANCNQTVRRRLIANGIQRVGEHVHDHLLDQDSVEIGRASCRERV